MRFGPTTIHAVVLTTLAVAVPSPATADQDAFADEPAAQVLLLGTFHFDDPGLDDYQPQFPWDPAEPEHQREIEEVVRLLAAYRPTLIALEWPIARQDALDSAYADFLAGRTPAGPNERDQLGFRLAREMGHERVYGIDAAARSYFPDMTQDDYDQRVERLMEGADIAVIDRQQRLEARYETLARASDSLKTTMPLRDYLLRENDPDELRVSHGQYLIGGFYLGRGDDYLGPDMRTRWYNRNLRIVHNLQRLTRSPEERILVIIGAGHVPILGHAFEASPEYRLREVAEYLGRPPHPSPAPSPSSPSRSW
jgi:hypothetical protein